MEEWRWEGQIGRIRGQGLKDPWLGMHLGRLVIRPLYPTPVHPSWCHLASLQTTFSKHCENSVLTGLREACVVMDNNFLSSAQIPSLPLGVSNLLASPGHTGRGIVWAVETLARLGGLEEGKSQSFWTLFWQLLPFSQGHSFRWTASCGPRLSILIPQVSLSVQESPQSKSDTLTGCAWPLPLS